MSVERHSALERFRSSAADGEAPTEEVLEVAARVEVAVEKRAMPPDRWAAIPDGGLSCYFFGRALTSEGAHERVARLAFGNESTTLLLDDLRSGTHELTEEDPAHDLDALLDRIALHVAV